MIDAKPDAWTPIQLGDVQLSHRVVLAPLTRCRATKSKVYPSTWVPNDLMKQYYTERATPGGLLISEASPVSLRASGMPGIPGWFTPEQRAAWIPIVEAVHAKGAIFFTQLWHQGRTTHSSLIGQAPESSASTPMQGMYGKPGQQSIPYDTPHGMTVEEIQATQDDFVKAALASREAGFDGLEIHAGNGYLFDQFHHSNINTRTDAYGGSIANRCRFTLETVDKLCAAIGPGRLGVRLSPYGLFNQAEGEDRLEQWTYLCEKLSHYGLAYVHLIEPRFDEFKSASEKEASLQSMSKGIKVSLAPFRKVLGDTLIISAGGWGPNNLSEGIVDGSHDLVAFGRFFVANPDLVARLQTGQPLYKWDRSRFYGPFDDNEVGYTTFPQREFANATDGLKAQLAD
ncbi:hypothetical protein IAU60_005470 [Kwoniella sp. DSM 27419]